MRPAKSGISIGHFDITTTGHTEGFVHALFATVQVKFDLFKKATFVDQIIISQSPGEADFSNGGDSGSLIYDSDNNCIGLLFAGSEGSGDNPATTIANPILTVLRELDLGFLSPGEHPAEELAAKRPRRRPSRKRSEPRRR